MKHVQVTDFERNWFNFPLHYKFERCWPDTSYSIFSFASPCNDACVIPFDSNYTAELTTQGLSVTDLTDGTYVASVSLARVGTYRIFFTLITGELPGDALNTNITATVSPGPTSAATSSMSGPGTLSGVSYTETYILLQGFDEFGNANLDGLIGGKFTVFARHLPYEAGKWGHCFSVDIIKRSCPFPFKESFASDLPI